VVDVEDVVGVPLSLEGLEPSEGVVAVGVLDPFGAFVAEEVGVHPTCGGRSGFLEERSGVSDVVFGFGGVLPPGVDVEHEGGVAVWAGRLGLAYSGDGAAHSRDLEVGQRRGVGHGVAGEGVDDVVVEVSELFGLPVVLEPLCPAAVKHRLEVGVGTHRDGVAGRVGEPA
jgi:hypothetical protein